MGLDITHDAWHGAYSAFARWREKLAEVVGIPLDLMEGHYSDGDDYLYAGIVPGSNTSILASRMKAMEALLPLKWGLLKPDILHELLHHSDCDGELAPEICEPLANRLEELLPLLNGDGGGHIGNYREKTQKFINGLRLAASLGEAVEFH